MRANPTMMLHSQFGLYIASAMTMWAPPFTLAGLRTLDALLSRAEPHSDAREQTGCSCKRANRPSWIARQPDSELAKLANRALDRKAAAVLLRHDVVADRETKAGSFASWLGGEERLE
jgi:hypothetical protein